MIEQDVILCTAPSTQATTFNFNTVTTTSCNVTFTRGNGTGGVLVVARQGSAVNTDPTSGTSYTANSSFGSGSQIGTGNWVVFNSNSPSSGTVTVPVNNLVGGQTYHFAIYEYNATATCYNMTELAGSVAIPICSPPSVQASGQNTPTINSTNATIAWTGNGNGDAGVIVVVRQGSAVNADPVNTTTYTANTAFGIGSQIGTGNYVAYIGSGSSVNVTGLLPNTAYHYAIYTYNSSGPCYMTPAAIGNFTSANGPMAYISSTSIQQTGSVLPGSVN
ncbi:MAG: hypothetical protein M0D57_10775 [Sphingobacteriales bacterium JAD_PAG50586_3]|nr:MAG: hypothetical protein M0D57_10775 [Sphingobacteriales bacterium JAD_PAG50586_3]